MLSYSMDDKALREMIADYMEKGFLENITDMYRHDSNLYYMIADLMKDERIRVRLGISALVETLSEEDKKNIRKAIPGLIQNLNDEDARVRGDAAYLLGMIGDRDIVPHLMKLLDDDDDGVREIAEDSISEINGRSL